MENNQDFLAGQQNYESQGKNKKKTKLLLIVIPITILVLAILAVFVFLNPLSLLSKAAEPKDGKAASVVEAYIDQDKSAHFVNEDGTTVKLNGDIIEAYQTADRKHFIILEEDGTLYVTDAKGENKKTISSEATDILHIRNSGIIYKYWRSEVTEATVDDIMEMIAIIGDYDLDDVVEHFNIYYSNDLDGAKEMYMDILSSEWEDESKQINSYYRYTFADELLVELGEDIHLNVAYDTLAAIISVDERVYLLPEDVQEREQVGKYSEENVNYMSNVSNSGKIGVWAETVEGQSIIYLSRGSDYEKIEQYDNQVNDYFFTIVYFLDDDKGVLISSSATDKIFRYYEGGEVESIRLGWKNKVPWLRFNNYDDYGYISDNESIDEFYVSLQNDDYLHNVYHVDSSGEREKILANINSLSDVKNNYLYYIDSDDNLRMAQYDEGNLTDERKISFDVYSWQRIRFSSDGKFLYYFKDVSADDSTGSLFYYDIQNDESVKIASDIHPNSIYLNSDGKKVYYFKDVSDPAVDYYTTSDLQIGSLYQYTIGDEDDLKLGSDILVASLKSGYYDNMLDEKAIVWLKYAAKDDTALFADVQHFNGDTAITIIRDIKILFDEYSYYYG